MTGFTQQDDVTIGVEEEFQIIDPETGSLVDASLELLEELPEGGSFQPEIFLSVLETATPVCRDVDEVREQIVRLRAELADVADDHGLTISATGTHPSALWEDQTITPKDRYQGLVSALGLPVKRDLVFGQHVHVGVGSPEEAIYVFNGLRPFLPLLVSLSTNSPFWRGMPAGLKSTRTRVFSSMPRSGLPRALRNWHDFEHTVNLLKRGGAIPDESYLWWDIRPRAQLGTVEIRALDVGTRVEDAVALTGLVQALVAQLSSDHRRGAPLGVQMHGELLEENRWRALRAGLEAQLYKVDDHGAVTTHELARELDRALAFAEDAIDELGLSKQISHLQEMVKRKENGADRQLSIWQDRQDIQDVILTCAAETTRG